MAEINAHEVITFSYSGRSCLVTGRTYPIREWLKAVPFDFSRDTRTWTIQADDGRAIAARCREFGYPVVEDEDGVPATGNATRLGSPARVPALPVTAPGGAVLTAEASEAVLRRAVEVLAEAQEVLRVIKVAAAKLAGDGSRLTWP